MEKSKKILKVENLKKAYYSTSRTGEIITYPVLNNVSFEIEEGEFVGIMGRSGCGKTTLLKAVGMLDKPDDGTIYYKDKDTKDIYRAELARLRRTEIAFVFQDYYLMDSLSIKENIILLRHVLPNSLLPLITLLGLSLGSLLGGTAVVEVIFSYPGLGQATVSAGLKGDLPLLMGILIISCIFVYSGNMIADLLYRVIDPRIKRGEEA